MLPIRTNKETYYVMDIIKFILCLCVIAIHTSVSDSFRYGNLICKCVFRLGVPYFMISSGFLLGMKLRKCNDLENLQSIVIKFVKRLLLMLVVFEPISLFWNACIYVHSGRTLGYAILETIQGIIFYPPGALWYIQALLVGVLLLYPRIKVTVEAHRNNMMKPYYKAYFGGALIGILLYCIALLANSYYFVIVDTPIQKVIDTYLEIAISARNGVFYGLFLISLGFLCAEANFDTLLENGKLNAGKIVSSGIVLYLLYVCEIVVLDGRAYVDDGALFVFQVPFVLWLMVVSVQRKRVSCQTVIFRNLSTGMYLLHFPILNVGKVAIKAFGFHNSHIILFFLVVVSSLLICLICYRSNWRIASVLK